MEQRNQDRRLHFNGELTVTQPYAPGRTRPARNDIPAARVADRAPQAAFARRFFILVLMRSCFSGERYSTKTLPCR